MRYWLMKSEPDVYSIDDLAHDGRTAWEGVRNYQARNYLRDQVQVGDKVLFYHSSIQEPGVAGVAYVCRAAYPDPTAFDRACRFYDPRSTPDAPIWYCVDLAFLERFRSPVTIARLRATAGLAGMLVIRRGIRLSVQPVERQHFSIVCRLGRQTVKR
jgi:predicted RNA-binding protein with PUA-like domain